MSQLPVLPLKTQASSRSGLLPDNLLVTDSPAVNKDAIQLNWASGEFFSSDVSGRLNVIGPHKFTWGVALVGGVALLKEGGGF